MSIISVQLPQYELQLPITGRKIKYRPFVVREQKILILALEDQNIPAIIGALRQIIKACTFDEVEVDSIPRADAEYLFIQIRNKSMTPGVDVYGTCQECEHRTVTQLNFDAAEISPKDSGKATIKLDEDFWVELESPSLAVAYDAMDADASAEYITASAIKTIIKGDESFNTSEYSMEQRIEFLENLTYSQSKLIDDFFLTLPKLKLEHTYSCASCGAENKLILEGLEDFFI